MAGALEVFTDVRQAQDWIEDEFSSEEARAARRKRHARNTVQSEKD